MGFSSVSLVELCSQLEHASVEEGFLRHRRYKAKPTTTVTMMIAMISCVPISIVWLSDHSTAELEDEQRARVTQARHIEPGEQWPSPGICFPVHNCNGCYAL